MCSTLLLVQKYAACVKLATRLQVTAHYLVSVVVMLLTAQHSVTVRRSIILVQ